MVWIVVAIAILSLIILRNLKKDQPEKKISLAVLPKRFVVLDLETTGLLATRHEIIEIGAIRVNRDSTTHETFQTLVKTSAFLPKKIVEITGITQSMIDGEGVSMETALAEFMAFIGDLPLVTFNAEFDMAFLQKAANGQGVSIKNKTSCALTMSRRAWPGLKSYRLQNLAKIAGLSTGEAHRALADCQLTLTVYCAAGSKLGTDC
jgi:DNA polymerase-3 subunit epsilon